MEETRGKKNGFFQRLKIAIFKLEDYGMFLGENPGVAFKYFFLLIAISTIIISIAYTFDFAKIVFKASDFINNHIPEFSLESGKLNFNEYVEGYDYDFNYKLIINTFEITNDEINKYSDEIRKTGNGLLLLNNKACLFFGGTLVYENNYDNILSEYGISISDKDDLLSIINNKEIYLSIILFFIVCIIGLYIIDTIAILADLCFVSIIGWFISKLCGLSLLMIGAIELSIYSLTLSILLRAFYIFITIITSSFTIDYFNIIYLLIAYVYLIASLFMVRDDLIKQQQEIERILNQQAKKEKEIENSEETEDSDENIDGDKDTEEKENEEENQNEEPDGSEI